MKIQAFLFLVHLITHGCCDSDLPIGYQVKLSIPILYISGFIGRAFLMDTTQKEPNFRVAITVEAVNQVYSCSLDILLGNVKVWSSGHSLPFYASDECTLELTQSGDLQLRSQKDRIGWRSGTSQQGVKRLQLLSSGNLVLVDAMGLIKWQSFNFPTDVMLWGQRLSSRTRLTSFIRNSSLYYSFEIQSDKIALYLISGKWKYSYWELKSPALHNIIYVQLTANGLEIFNSNDQKIAQLNSQKTEPLRFLALENASGNLGLYYYSTSKAEFEPSYQALNTTCDFPLACKPYGICTFSNSCSCLHLITKGTESLPDCNDATQEAEGLCGNNQAEMLELPGVASVLRSGPSEVNVSQEGCSNLCLDDCTCAAALYSLVVQECYLYGMTRGVKQVGRGSGTVFMVKVPKGSKKIHGKSSGLRKWEVILIAVVDGFIIVVVLGGIAFYTIRKRRKDSIDAGRPP